MASTEVVQAVVQAMAAMVGAVSVEAAMVHRRLRHQCRPHGGGDGGGGDGTGGDGSGDDGMGHNGGGGLREVAESLGLVTAVAAVEAAAESQLAQQGARQVAEGMVEVEGSEAVAIGMARVAAVTGEVAETEAVDLAAEVKAGEVWEAGALVVEVTTAVAREAAAMEVVSREVETATIGLRGSGGDCAGPPGGGGDGGMGHDGGGRWAGRRRWRWRRRRWRWRRWWGWRRWWRRGGRWWRR